MPTDQPPAPKIRPAGPCVYRLELGLNLNVASLFETRWKHRYFPLENALVDVTVPSAPQPAWYTHLHENDEISIRLVDISDLREPKLPPLHPALVHFHFTEPESGQPMSPFLETVDVWKIAGEPTLRWSPVFSRYEHQKLATWDIHGESPDGGMVSLVLAPVENLFRGFELSVVLRIDREPFSDFFVFDPEMIVSETDVPTEGNRKDVRTAGDQCSAAASSSSISRS